jgi:hypothetical protein
MRCFKGNSTGNDYFEYKQPKETNIKTDIEYTHKVKNS